MMGESRVGIWTLLFAFLGAPVAWVVHFNVIYFLNTLFCTTGWSGGDAAVILGSVPFVVVSAVAGVVAWRRWSELRGSGSVLEGLAEAGQKSAVLLMMGVAGSVLFTLIIVLESMAPLFVASCPEVMP